MVKNFVQRDADAIVLSGDFRYMSVTRETRVHYDAENFDAVFWLAYIGTIYI